MKKDRYKIWSFSVETTDKNLDEITIFCFLNCNYECINGFRVLKNPLAHSVYIDFATRICNPTLCRDISGKIK